MAAEPVEALAHPQPKPMPLPQKQPRQERGEPPAPKLPKGKKIAVLLQAQSRSPKPWQDLFWFWADPLQFPLLQIRFLGIGDNLRIVKNQLLLDCSNQEETRARELIDTLTKDVFSEGEELTIISPFNMFHTPLPESRGNNNFYLI